MSSQVLFNPEYLRAFRHVAASGIIMNATGEPSCTVTMMFCYCEKLKVSALLLC